MRVLLRHTATASMCGGGAEGELLILDTYALDK